MPKIDYLLVGQGLAGSCFAMQLLQHKKTFLVIDLPDKCASRVAAGVFNPVVLKRFAPVWDAQNQIELLLTTFSLFEKLLHKKYIYKMPVLRLFHNENEKEIWTKKAKNLNIHSFLQQNFIPNSFQNINASHGFGKVNETGRIDVENLLNDFRRYLAQQNNLSEEIFDYHKMDIQENEIHYKENVFSKIVFCEGFGLKQNPYFNYLPLIASKGEVIHIQTEDALPEAILNSKIACVPLKDQTYYIGASYDRENETDEITQKATVELSEGFENMSSTAYKIVSQKAGIRPTVIDRRPLVGRHPNHKNLIVLNGMGTRGTMLAPKMAQELFLHLEENKTLDPIFDIQRFETLFIDKWR